MKQEFKASTGTESVTTEITSKIFQKLRLIDTPGFGDLETFCEAFQQVTMTFRWCTQNFDQGCDRMSNAGSSSHHCTHQFLKDNSALKSHFLHKNAVFHCPIFEPFLFADASQEIRGQRRDQVSFGLTIFARCGAIR